MNIALLGLGLAVMAVGCGDEGAMSRASEGAGNPSAAGSGGGDFGNSQVAVPPPTTTATVVAGGKCKPGHYLGQLDGMYESPAAVGFTPGGVPISTDPMAVDAAILNMLFPPVNGASPGFEFWLEASQDVEPCAPDNEFCFDFKVEGGTAKGVANGLFPFEMELSGDLNCAAGKFEGLIQNGWYDVAGVRFTYEGFIYASYDADQAAFFDGTWVVTEPADPTAGGEGTWYTSWVDDEI